ncbi:MAG: hypothetical protein L0H79_21825, partial [Intrasporangium sp.]|uniref:hypothetical protein n=1 Tax=Intrasporangium sp. TaxID=1925024 RepID=UPI002647322A
DVPRSGSETEPGRAVGDLPSGPASRSAKAISPTPPTGAAPATREWWAPYLPALFVGALCIIAGGLVAAVTSPMSLSHGSWAAAYLVLVAGVAQIALAAGQGMLAGQARAGRRLLLVEFAGWNLGNAAVIAGTLWSATWLVNLGGAMLVVALGALLVATRGGPGRTEVARGRQVALLAVRALVALLLISIPVGLWLAYVRAR